MSRASWSSRSSSGTPLQDFHYDALRDKKNGIRLVKLKPGSGTKRISIELVESWLSRPGQKPHEPYDALSYTWGDSVRSKTILCNGKALKVTETLLVALSRFRDRDDVVTLWIDQICIWQKSMPERNSQVRMMGKIFMGARRVLVWLGDHSHDSQAGWQLIEQLKTLSNSHSSESTTSLLEGPGIPARGSPKWRALNAILNRGWFWRTWIVQEVVLNPNVELVLGGNSIDWDELEDVVALIQGPTTIHWEQDPTTSAWELPFARINRIRLRHRAANEPTFATETSGRYQCLPSFERGQNPYELGADANEIDLLDLLLMSRNLGATDPRDKVYALLGLSNHQLIPDYELSPEHVFNEFAMDIIGEACRLANHEHGGSRLSARTPEARKALILLSSAGCHNARGKLPSWVPDWTSNLLSRPLIFDPRFRAGGEELEVDWHFETGLQLCGKLVDTVESAGEIRLAYPTSNPQATIAAWWREAKYIANARAVQSPGSTARMDALQTMRRDLGLCRCGYCKPSATSGDSAAERRMPNRRPSLLDEHDHEQPSDSTHNMYDAYRTLEMGPTRGRVMFATTTGYIGLAPHGTREGDLVYIVLGSGVPYVFRPQPTEEALTLIGEAYVQGIMSGEALVMDQRINIEAV